MKKALKKAALLCLMVSMSVVATLCLFLCSAFVYYAFAHHTYNVWWMAVLSVGYVCFVITIIPNQVSAWKGAIAYVRDKQ